MRKTLILIASITMACTAHAESINKTIDGVTLNISADEVKQQWGAAKQENMTEPNACNGDAPDMELHYDGALVTLSENADGGYSVTSVDVTSTNRSIAGLRIGDSADKIEEVFGPADVVEDTLLYDFGEAGSGQAYEFTIDGGKLTHIKLNSFMC